jgi:hypothetical protein
VPTLRAVAVCRLANWNGSTLLYGPGANGSMLAIDIVAAAAVLIITALLVRLAAEISTMQHEHSIRVV